MAIVADRASVGTLDKSFVSHNRVVADNPNAAETPQYRGEIVYDSTTEGFWQAQSATAQVWASVTLPVY